MSFTTASALFTATFLACLSTSLFAADTPPASQPAAQRIKLWDTTPNLVPGKDTDVDPAEPNLHIYPTSTPTENAPPLPAIIIFPGGGYVNLSTTREGKDVANLFASHEVATFVLRYRHAPRYNKYIPLQDAQRAIRTVRTNAAQYHVDPHRIGVMGFSAGGSLAALAATDTNTPTLTSDAIDSASARPDFAILLYPVINLDDPTVAHKGSRVALVGDDDKLATELSAEKRVTKNTPPILLFHAAPDRVVPVENSILFFEACHKLNIPAELHIFPTGGHGFGISAANPVLNTWPTTTLHWLSILPSLSPKPSAALPPK